MSIYSPELDDSERRIYAGYSMKELTFDYLQLDALKNDDSLSPSYIGGSESFQDSGAVSPKNFRYYDASLSKTQFNSILINNSVNLLRILYPDSGPTPVKLRFFLVELLRRSKASVHVLQIACFYMAKIVRSRFKDSKLQLFPKCPKQLFLALIILSSKFSQDRNYSLQYWLKICGCKDNQSDLNMLSLGELRQVERNCLKLLEFNCSLTGRMYENWCNILAIFGYEFIKSQSLDNSLIEWESNGKLVDVKLEKWKRFYMKMDNFLLEITKVDFKKYYMQQIGTKVLNRGIQNGARLGTKRVCNLSGSNESLNVSKKFKSVTF